MDRDDARFVADALASRIAGDREALDRIAAESAVRLLGAAARLSSLAADWPPALLASFELKAIGLHGSAAAEGEPNPELQIFVDKLRELADEPVRAAGPRNRFERRATAKLNLSRRDRLTGIREELNREQIARIRAATAQ